MRYTRPFLKWPGGKFKALEILLPLMPQVKTLVEPFVGAGAVFLNAPFSKFVLNDLNHDLINLYQTLLTQKQKFIKQTQHLFVPEENQAERYYFHRAHFNQSSNNLSGLGSKHCKRRL